MKMSENSDKFLEAIYDMVEILIGKRPNYTNRAIEKEMKLMKRARNADGTYKGDDPTTEHINEAWVSPFPTPKPSIKWTRKQLIDYCEALSLASGAGGDDNHYGLRYVQNQTDLTGWDNVYLMHLYGGDAARTFAVQADGKVGIGTDVTPKTLTVQGDISASGNIYLAHGQMI